ncbi:MAG TPA: hypothetical protein VIA62_09850 [Thermoanaerobaculia bacterium]|jgi:hypothetical protein|nr:hypothetical protein [Thermoanaerobaculia bacterium]
MAVEIRRADVRELLEGIARERGGVCANRALVSRVFTFGIEKEHVESNPVYAGLPGTWWKLPAELWRAGPSSRFRIVIVLDINVVSALMWREPDPVVVAWLDGLL